MCLLPGDSVRTEPHVQSQAAIQQEMIAELGTNSLTEDQLAVVQRLTNAKGIHTLNGCPGAGKTFTTKWYVLAPALT